MLLYKKKQNKKILAFVLIFGLLFPLSLNPQPVYASDNHAVAISTSSEFALALKSDGTVWGWGNNSSGQLGDGSFIAEDEPVQVRSISGVQAISAGGNYGIALKEDGTVWMWGNGKTAPFQVQGLSEMISVSAGSHQAVGLKKDGTVWTWATNGASVQQVESLSRIVFIETGYQSSYAVKEDGTVWAWGLNDQGQLGDGTLTNKTSPVQVQGLTNIVKISASRNALALKEDGTVWQWGRIIDENNNIRDQYTPSQVKSLSGVTEISAGDPQFMAVKEDGTAWVWGQSSMAGDGQVVNRGIPAQVQGIGIISKISSGYYYNLILDQEGIVWSWGQRVLGNGSAYGGQIPAPTLLDSAPNPPKVVRTYFDKKIPLYDQPADLHLIFNHKIDPGTVTKDNITLEDDEGNPMDFTLSSSSKSININIRKIALAKNYHLRLNNLQDYYGVSIPAYTYSFTGCLGKINRSEISAGGLHSMVKRSWDIYTWGNNQYGQLGDGTTINRTIPVKINALSNKTFSVSAGGFHSLALLQDGTVMAWGLNDAGQLGDGSTESRSEPVLVEGLQDIAFVEAGDQHSLALKNDGTVWAWGHNLYGQLGDGTHIDREIPVQVRGLSDVKYIAAGGMHSLAIKTDGTVWAWGANSTGQLGNNSTQNSSIPVQVQGLSGVQVITAGWAHSLALKTDGALWGWGDNQFKQIAGDKPVLNSIPVKISEGIEYVDAGYYHNLSKSKIGRAWGNNNFGQLGKQSEGYQSDPNSVSLGGGYYLYSVFSAGGGHNLYEGSNHEVMAWGLNNSGQIGDGSTYHRADPTTAVLKDGSIYYRLAGNNRIETAVNVSYQGWNYGAQAVVLARDDAFPDALTGAPLAKAVNAPILLTNKKTLTQETEQEIERLNPAAVFILGSTGAVSEDIENQLAQKYEVIRLGGTDRYDTSAKIAEFLNKNKLNAQGKAVVAFGGNFPDALAVSSLAAYQRIPILLTATHSLPEPTRNALEELKVTETIIVGGSGVVSDQVANQLPSQTRIAGADRYQTALAIAKNMNADRKRIFIATGKNFPDALAGSALAAQTNSPIVLIDNHLAQGLDAYLFQASENQYLGLMILGGTGAVSDEILYQISENLKA